MGFSYLRVCPPPWENFLDPRLVICLKYCRYGVNHYPINQEPLWQRTLKMFFKVRFIWNQNQRTLIFFFKMRSECTLTLLLMKTLNNALLTKKYTRKKTFATLF